MRIVKEANVRKNEILDSAARLFQEKGYDNASTNDILADVGIARGTLYHHFKSKEDIMDALIERQTEKLIAAARTIADDKRIPVEERMIRTIRALNVSSQEDGGKAMLEHLHQTQNALMHQKINRIMMQQVPPILAEILTDGIDQGLYDTPYPLECMEMSMVYLNTVFDDEIFELTQQECISRINAFIFNMERLLHTEAGKLDYFLKLFESEKN